MRIKIILNLSGLIIGLFFFSGCALHNQYVRPTRQVIPPKKGLRVAVLPTVVPKDNSGRCYPFWANFAKYNSRTKRRFDEEEWRDVFTQAITNCLRNTGDFNKVDMVKISPNQLTNLKTLYNEYNVVFASELTNIELETSAFLYIPTGINLFFPPMIFSLFGLPTAFDPATEFRLKLYVQAYSTDNHKAWNWNSGLVSDDYWIWGSSYHIRNSYFETLTGKLFDKFEEALKTFPIDKLETELKEPSIKSSSTQSILPIERPVKQKDRSSIAVWQLTPITGESKQVMHGLTEILRSTLQKSGRVQADRPG